MSNKEHRTPNFELELEAAHLVIMLVSADALNSDFIEKKELKIALEKKRAGTARVVPSLVRDCFLQADREAEQKLEVARKKREAAAQQQAAEPKRRQEEAEQQNSLPEMVSVQGGTLNMGAKYQVTLSDYQILPFEKKGQTRGCAARAQPFFCTWQAGRICGAWHSLYMLSAHRRFNPGTRASLFQPTDSSFSPRIHLSAHGFIRGCGGAVK